MATTELERPTVKAQVQATGGSPIALISAVAFVIAGVWYALIVKNVTQSAAPVPLKGASEAAGFTQFYRWVATTVAQERLVVGVAIFGFATLIAAVWAIRERLTASPAATAGTVFATLGSAAWIVGALFLLGGHRAIGLMATHTNPIETTNSIAFTVDVVHQAFELAAFAMLGAGLACLAVAARGGDGFSGGWARLTGAIAAVLLVLAYAYAADNGDLQNILLVATAVVLVPAWLMISGRAQVRAS